MLRFRCVLRALCALSLSCARRPLKIATHASDQHQLNSDVDLAEDLAIRSIDAQALQHRRHFEELNAVRRH